MAEQSNNNPKTGKNTGTDGKGGKPKFNLNWILAAAALGFIVINLLFGGRNLTKSKEWGDVERMIENRKDMAEIYLKPEAIESGRYPEASGGGNAFSMGQTGPNFVYNIASVELFDKRLSETQERVGYTQSAAVLLVPTLHEPRWRVLPTKPWM